ISQGRPYPGNRGRGIIPAPRAPSVESDRGHDASPVPARGGVRRMFRHATRRAAFLLVLLACLFAGQHAAAQGNTQGKKPNILFIMGDDVGWFNVVSYHRGIMSGKTPNLDRLAAQGMMFTDYYAEASCTAGRANFITGELPIR